MSNIKYDKILNYLCEYFGVCDKEFIKIISEKEMKYIFLLLLKRNDIFYLEKINKEIRRENIKDVKKILKDAEVKLLINKEFRDKYFEIECELRKKLK